MRRAGLAYVAPSACLTGLTALGRRSAGSPQYLSGPRSPVCTPAFSRKKGAPSRRLDAPCNRGHKISQVQPSPFVLLGGIHTKNASSCLGFRLTFSCDGLHWKAGSSLVLILIHILAINCMLKLFETSHCIMSAIGGFVWSYSQKINVPKTQTGRNIYFLRFSPLALSACAFRFTILDHQLG